MNIRCFIDAKYMANLLEPIFSAFRLLASMDSPVELDKMRDSDKNTVFNHAQYIAHIAHSPYFYASFLMQLLVSIE
jgi:hypothetical protein